MGWLRNFLGKEKMLEDADLSQLKTDFHSHLIPGIDDGSPDMESSLEMIRKFKELGYQKLITTPHVMSDFYKNDNKIILDGLSELRTACAEAEIDIELEASAEYYLDENFEKLIDSKEILSFSGDFVLFELSFLSEPQNLNEIIFKLQMAGYRTILAHPERYSFWYGNFDKYRELKNRSVLFQLNMLSLSGAYSPEAKKIAERLIDEEMIEFLGSDCHNIHQLEMIEANLGRKYLHKLLDSGKIMNYEL